MQSDASVQFIESAKSGAVAYQKTFLWVVFDSYTMFCLMRKKGPNSEVWKVARVALKINYEVTAYIHRYRA